MQKATDCKFGMAENEKGDRTIEVFQTRVRQLMYEYETVCKDNDSLLARISDKDAEIEGLKAQVRALEDKVVSLKTARMLSISDGDVERSRKRIDSLIRQVDRCIALVNV